MKKLIHMNTFAGILALLIYQIGPIAFAKGMESLKGTGTYGNAGCGLGSMVFTDESGFVQVLAATLNGATSTQTMGMTTGTSNCGPSVFAKEKIQQFIVSNNVALETDIARGEGETLDNLNQLLGCRGEFSVFLNSKYKELYGENVTAPRISEKILKYSTEQCKGS